MVSFLVKFVNSVEFSAGGEQDVPEMLKDKLTISIICPSCECTNVITILDDKEIEISRRFN
jgi:hypothetical protein